jgi:hypothetical protein
MRRLPGIALLVALVAITPVLAGCDSFDPDSLDPFGLNAKKKLPGQRELLFPNGVPGVTQGIPPEYKEGYKQPGIGDLPPGDADATPAAPATQTAKSEQAKPVRESNLGKPRQVRRPAAKPKPKRRVVRRKPKPRPAVTETASRPRGTSAPWPGTPQQTAAQPRGAQAPWPSTAPQQTQSSQPAASGDQTLAPWPSAPPSGTFSK